MGTAAERVAQWYGVFIRDSSALRERILTLTGRSPWTGLVYLGEPHAVGVMPLLCHDSLVYAAYPVEGAPRFFRFQGTPLNVMSTLTPYSWSKDPEALEAVVLRLRAFRASVLTEHVDLSPVGLWAQLVHDME